MGGTGLVTLSERSLNKSGRMDKFDCIVQKAAETSNKTKAVGSPFAKDL